MTHITHGDDNEGGGGKGGTEKQLYLVNWATCPCAAESEVTLQARGPNGVQRRRCEPWLLQSTIAPLSLYLRHMESSGAVCICSTFRSLLF